MKKFILLISALFYTVVAYAQGTDQVSAILQHGDTETIFIGNTGLEQAYSAAVDGDVIILSQGIFNSINNISKVLTIYGAGFEDNAETNTATTTINGTVRLGDGSDTEFDGIHIEGVKINGYMGLNSQLKNVTIQRCRITNDIEFNHNTENVTFRQCYMNAGILGQYKHANGLLISNCYVSYTVNKFSVNSFVHIDHSYCGHMYSYRDRGSAQFLWTNSIINKLSGDMPSGYAAIVKNCIFFADNYYNDVNLENCYRLSSIADIFADGENADYSPTRTFELKDPTTYVGTDGTPIGLSGGAGWNKVPSNPYVSKVNTTLSGTQLNVTYEVGVNK